MPVPEQPWTSDLERLRTDLREEIARSGAETRRHFDVVAEHFMSRLQLVAEGVTIVDQKLDRLRADVEQRFDRVERRLLRLS
jgi:hypothetical protein